MTIHTDDRMRALWRFLDLMLDAGATVYDIDRELAGYAGLAALAAAELLSMPDDVVRRMHDSALADVRRQRMTTSAGMSEDKPAEPLRFRRPKAGGVRPPEQSGQDRLPTPETARDRSNGVIQFGRGDA